MIHFGDCDIYVYIILYNYNYIYIYIIVMKHLHVWPGRSDRTQAVVYQKRAGEDR